MKKKILDYFQSINCINVFIHGCNCCKTGIEVSKCVYLASMAVKIEHIVAGHNYDILQQCIFDIHASRSTGPKRGKIAKIYDFSFRESSRHKHKCPYASGVGVHLFRSRLLSYL